MAGPRLISGRQPLARAATAELTAGTALQPAAQATPVLRPSHSWGVPQVRPGCLLSSLHSPRAFAPRGTALCGHIPACPSAGCPSWARPVLTDAPPEADGAGIPCVTLNKLGFPCLRCGRVRAGAPWTRAGATGGGREVGAAIDPVLRRALGARPGRRRVAQKPSVGRGGAQGESWVLATCCASGLAPPPSSTSSPPARAQRPSLLLPLGHSSVGPGPRRGISEADRSLCWEGSPAGGPAARGAHSPLHAPSCPGPHIAHRQARGRQTRAAPPG